MKFLSIFIFCASSLCFVPLGHCFFIRNPFNWFRFGSSNAVQNDTTESNTFNNSTFDSTNNLMSTPTQTPINPLLVGPEMQPQQEAFPDIQPIEPIHELTPTRLGIPIKINRFGLEPLPYPLKRVPVRYPAINVPHFNLGQNQNLIRRYGDQNEETTASTIGVTQYSADHKLSPTQQYLTTFESIRDVVKDQNITDSHQNEYQITDELLEEIAENTSPTPVYISSSTTIDDKPIPSRSTTIKPQYLHRSDFASQLNNMYYNRPEVFQPLMDKFEERYI